MQFSALIQWVLWVSRTNDGGRRSSYCWAVSWAKCDRCQPVCEGRRSGFTSKSIQVKECMCNPWDFPVQWILLLWSCGLLEILIETVQSVMVQLLDLWGCCLNLIIISWVRPLAWENGQSARVKFCALSSNGSRCSNAEFFPSHLCDPSFSSVGQG